MRYSSDAQAMTIVPLDAMESAARAIAPHIHRTATTGSSYFSQASGARVLLKLELFQKTGSFKVRGVVNTLRQLSNDERSRGVVSLSAGNHAQALAWGATQLGVASVIVMPVTAVASKVAATRGYGGEVVQTAGDLLQTALDIQQERGMTLIHPFDDPRVIAGQGTVGLELLEDVPDVDTVLVSIGGGGLISGVAAAIKQSRPNTRVIGVEPAGSAVMTQSLAAGSPQRLAVSNTMADGLAAPFAGVHTFAHVQQLVDDIVLVSEAEIREGTVALMERCKLFAETAAGAAVAPLLNNRLNLAGQTVAAVICGGNIDVERLCGL